MEITREKIKYIADMIVENIHPEKIILFGSAAEKALENCNDLDLFIIVDKSVEPFYRRPQEVYRCLRGVGVPMDIIVRTRKEVDEWMETPASLETHVMKNGVVLYEKQEKSVGEKLAKKS